MLFEVQLSSSTWGLPRGAPEIIASLLTSAGVVNVQLVACDWRTQSILPGRMRSSRWDLVTFFNGYKVVIQLARLVAWPTELIKYLLFLVLPFSLFRLRWTDHKCFPDGSTRKHKSTNSRAPREHKKNCWQHYFFTLSCEIKRQYRIIPLSRLLSTKHKKYTHSRT